MPRPDLAAAVERGDLDELIRVVDGLCLDADWDGLAELAERCRAALERGRQLWPAAAHADYRLALEAPGRWAGPTVAPGRGRFAPGPLAEVAASTHTWEELAPHLPPGPLAAVVAHERVVRGEDLTGDERIDPAVMELPLRLAQWEPAYPLAVYRADGAEFPLDPLEPAGPAGPVAPVAPPTPDGAAETVDPESVRALVDIAATWVTESGGRAEAVAVEGGAAEAAARLSVVAAGSVVPVAPADALAHMAWCGASGGAHGRRRGMAAGRFAAWWALAAMTALLDDWPVAPDDLGAAVAALRFHRIDAPGPVTGWRLALAVEDAGAGLGWAVWAEDPARQAGPSTRSV